MHDTVIKFLTNYIQGRKQFTLYKNTKWKHATFKIGVPQRGVLLPTLFNIYTSDIQTPANNEIKLIKYADDIAILSTYANIYAAKQ